MEKIKIFSAYYKQYYIPKSPIFCPIHVGHINSQNELGLLADDTGDNISSKNLTFNEVTAQYWVWKNYKEAEFVGFCHYRRYLIYPSENNIYNKISNKIRRTFKIKNKNFTTQMDEKLNLFTSKILNDTEKYDIFVPREILMPLTLEEQYEKFHVIDHYIQLGKSIEKEAPELSKYFMLASSRKAIFLGNLFIMKFEIFDNYMQKAIKVLEDVEKNIVLPDDAYQRRAIGFLSERLFTVFMYYILDTQDYKVKKLDILNSDSLLGQDSKKQEKSFSNTGVKKNSKNIFFAIDSFSSDSFQNIEVMGWAVLPKVNNKFIKKFIQLYSSNEKYTYSLEDSLREDIVLENTSYPSSGFYQKINTEDLIEGKYSVKLILEDEEKQQFISYLEDYKVFKNENGIVIIKI